MAPSDLAQPEAAAETEADLPPPNAAKSTTIGVHDLLKPAQNEIKAQLRRLRKRLRNEARETAAALQAAKAKRVDLGDELGKLQGVQESVSQKITEAASTLEGVHLLQQGASAKLATLCHDAEAESAATRQKRAKIQSLQLQLKKATEILYQVELAHAKENSDLAATKRAAYVAEDLVHHQLEENEKGSTLIEILRSNLQRLKELAATDRSAAENARKRQEAKDLEVRATEAAVANLRGEAALLEKRWEEEMRQLQKMDMQLQEKTTGREAIERKSGAAIVEASKLAEAAAKEAERNWKLGQNVNKALQRESEALKKIKAYQDIVGKAVASEQLAVARSAEASAKLAQHAAAAKEHERNADDLRRQELRTVTECASLRNKLDSLLDKHAETDGAIAACRNELREASAAAARKTEQIQNLEETILTLQKRVEESRENAESLTLQLEHAERDMAAATARLDSMQQEVEATLKFIDRRTREVQVLDKQRGKLAESANKDDAAPLRLEIKRLNEQLAAKEASQHSLRQQMAEAQERFSTASQRHLQLTDATVEAEKNLAALSQEHTYLLEAKQMVEKETLALKQRVKNLETQHVRLDAALDEANALHKSAESAIETQRAEQAVRIQSLDSACKDQEAKIKKLLTQHKETTTKAARLDQRLGQVPKEKREKASGVDSSENAGSKKVSTKCELEAARERLAAQISERKAEIALRASPAKEAASEK